LHSARSVRVEGLVLSDEWSEESKDNFVKERGN
jgi:hypothetical protein